MQTFLPETTFKESVQALDWKRLNKQRMECYQLLRALAGVSQGWRRHPVVEMWRGYEGALIAYAVEASEEALRRGLADRFGYAPIFSQLWSLGDASSVCEPHWYTFSLQERYRQHLIAKQPAYYRLRWPKLKARPMTRDDYKVKTRDDSRFTPAQRRYLDALSTAAKLLNSTR